MYVYEEMINGKKLTEIINETHENVKYLPGQKLPANVVSCNVKYNHKYFQCDSLFSEHEYSHPHYLFSKLISKTLSSEMN